MEKDILGPQRLPTGQYEILKNPRSTSTAGTSAPDERRPTLQQQIAHRRQGLADRSHQAHDPGNEVETTSSAQIQNRTQPYLCRWDLPRHENGVRSQNSNRVERNVEDNATIGLILNDSRPDNERHPHPQPQRRYPTPLTPYSHSLHQGMRGGQGEPPRNYRADGGRKYDRNVGRYPPLNEDRRTEIGPVTSWQRRKPLTESSAVIQRVEVDKRIDTAFVNVWEWMEDCRREGCPGFEMGGGSEEDVAGLARMVGERSGGEDRE